MVDFLSLFESFRNMPSPSAIVAALWLLAGQNGLGKSTMVNTLFKSKIWKSTMPGLRVPMPQTLQLHSVTHGE